MALAKTLGMKYLKNRCILCQSTMEKTTVGNLCNPCKDGFGTREDFAM